MGEMLHKSMEDQQITFAQVCAQCKYCTLFEDILRTVHILSCREDLRFCLAESEASNLDSQSLCVCICIPYLL